MRKSLSQPLALLVLLASVAASQEAQAWRKFEPEGEGFSVSLPSKPTAETKTNPDQPRMKMRMYTSEAGNLFFNISSFDTSKLFEPNAANFDSFIGGFLKSYCEPARSSGFQCEVTFERALKLNGFDGKQYKVAMSGNGRGVGGVLRVYMTTSHVYAMQALGAGEGDASVNKFLTSFHIAAAKPATK